MFVLNDGNERIKNQEKYRMSTSRRNQLAGRKTLPKNTRRKKKRGRKMLRIIMIPLLILLLFLLFKSCIQKKNQYADVDATQPEMDVQLLDINPYSRPGTAGSVPFGCKFLSGPCDGCCEDLQLSDRKSVV